MNFDLTDEHRLLEESVREWGAREVAPRIHELDRQHRFDPATPAADGRASACSASRFPSSTAAAGPTTSASAWRARSWSTSTPRCASSCRCTSGLNSLTLLVVGHRGPEAALPGAAGRGPEDRDLRPHRAGRRQRRARHPDGGRQEGRPLPPHRREDVDLARRRRRPLPGVRLVRPREEEAARPVRACRRSSSSGRSRGSRAGR